MVHAQLPALLLPLLVVLASCQNEICKPPKILEPNSARIVYKSANTLVKVDCRAEGIPQPTYKWTRNGNPIIVDNFVSYSEISGSLLIADFTRNEEGTYMCIASNNFDTGLGRVTASRLSPPIKLFQTRVDRFNTADPFKLQVTEYEYAILMCTNKGEVVGFDISINWYDSVKSKDVDMDFERLYIDLSGNLHFTHVRSKDSTVNFVYICGISSSSEKVIRLGNANTMEVLPLQNSPGIKPQLQYSNSGIKSLRFGKAMLECVFSGYDPTPPYVPVIQWFDDTGREIDGSTDKLRLSNDRRRLTINNLQEEDEGNYYCQARNSLGVSGKMAVFLDVTSAPMFNHFGAPSDQTVVEDVDVTFNCYARSASNEAPPNSPVWYINGLKMGQFTDPTKFKLSNGYKTLTVIKVKKPADILCVQCEVTNHVDTTWAGACLNVILPIKIERRPKEEQLIDHGDIIDLTVTASSDPSLTLSYRWEFGNNSFLGDDLPPFVSHYPDTMLTQINTSDLTEAQYRTVGGIYFRIISTAYETRLVRIRVVLKDKPVSRYQALNRALQVPGCSAENKMHCVASLHLDVDICTFQPDTSAFGSVL